MDCDSDVANSGFGALLRRLRVDAGLSQEELARAAKVSARSVSDLERGVSRTARPQTARLLAAALGLATEQRTAFLAASRGQSTKDGHRAVASVSAAAVLAGTRALPRDIGGFTGRSGELEWLAARLADAAGNGGVVGICAIGGLAGVGKTALAVHAAHELAAKYPDGQFFLPLHGHTSGQRPADPAEALASLLLAAGVPARQIPPGLQPRAARWRDFLAGKQVLLVLDDAAGHEQVEPLLPGTPGCAVLVTSRRRLAALTDAVILSLDVLAPGEAADLLVRLAGRPGLRPADPSVGELARLCGHLPLAIGMLASQLRHHPAWTPADLAADLAAERDRLTVMRAENLSVSAAFGLSYRDMTAAQRRLFRRLGLHPGHEIDEHAATALGGLTLATARRHLEAIYDEHLLAEPSRGRYRMHDLVREHARELTAVDDADVREAAAGRLLDYYLHTALAASRLIGTRILNYLGALPEGSLPACAPNLTSAADATQWMQAEDANLRAAAQQAAATGRVRHATLIPAAMAEFLYIQGRWQDGITLHQTALTAAQKAGDKASQLRALGPLVHMQVTTGDYENARTNLNHWLRLARELSAPADEAQAMVVVGLIHRITCDFPRAMASFQEALAIARDIGSDRLVAEAQNEVGAVHAAAGDYRAAAISHRQALVLYRAIGEIEGQATALIHLAIADLMTGDYARATAALDEAWPMTEDLGDRYLQGWVHNVTGIIQRHGGNHKAAMASHQAAFEHFNALSLEDVEAVALNELGLTLQLIGDFARAGACHQRALEVWRSQNDPLGQADVLNNLGELSLRLAAAGDGQQYHAQALALARDIGAQHEEARALEGAGRCHLYDGHTADSGALLRQALAIYQRLGAVAALAVQEMLTTMPP